MTDSVAARIASALNETHRRAMDEKARAAQAYRAEIDELKSREERLFDLFAAGDVDRETYDRQLGRLRSEQSSRFERLREIEGGVDEAAYLETARSVLELAKSARSLADGRSGKEQRDLFARVVRNPRLDGRTVRYDLKNPFAVLAQMHGEGGWRPRRDSNLRPQV